MKTNILIIHNPKAGTRKNIHLQDELIKHALFPFDFVETKHKKHATELAEKAILENYTLVIAAGGDGTVNEIATALAFSNVGLGIIPLGSGNGLARHLKIPLNIPKSIQLFNNINFDYIDQGKINEQSFFCTAGIGFDAEISKAFEESTTRGLKSYIYLGIKKYFSYIPKTYLFEAEGIKYKEKAFVLTFANASQFGNNAYISPNSKINDGFLDLTLVKPFPLLIGIVLVIRLFTKSILKSTYCLSIPGKHFKIINNKATNFHCDGEIYIANEDIEVQILPKSLKVVMIV